MKITVPLLLLLVTLTTRAATSGDPYLWLEKAHGKAALDWVHQQDARTYKRFDEDPLYKKLHADALSVLESPSRIPEVREMGNYIYNLWQDENHPRGLYRRASVTSFRTGKPDWQTVLDIDALSKSEGKRYSFRNMTCLPPRYVHCMMRLSPRGADAAESREFNSRTLQFVKGGFYVPVSRSFVSWRDADSLFFGPDLDADSKTRSGYPNSVRVWRRGEALTAAKLLFQASPDSVSAFGFRIRTAGRHIDLIVNNVTFWRSRFNELRDGKLIALDLPETARIRGGYLGKLVIVLKADWQRGKTTYRNGSVLLADPRALRDSKAALQLLVQPDASEVVESVDPTSRGVLVTLLDNVRGRLYRYSVSGGKVSRTPIAFPDNGAISIATSDRDSGASLIEYQSFLTPPTLYYLPGNATKAQLVTAQTPTFDAAPFSVHQYWTTSEDGTRIPYFVVAPKAMKFDGANPVWMFSYGGFENSLTPSYSGSYEDMKGAYGKLWLSRGGVFVLANIRGGGEFGPTWHTQALKANHIKAFEDFEAVARDLVNRKITSPAHLGIEGRSNGGLLVASTTLRHPALYGAVVCGSPLLDMKRYTKLGVGASWVAEYGDPDKPADWAYIKTYSPYQNVRPGTRYPPIFFYSATTDDRVHPGHARKMVAKMEAMGDDVYYYENTEGGHHGSATPAELAKRIALTYTFLWEHLK